MTKKDFISKMNSFATANNMKCEFGDFRLIASGECMKSATGSWSIYVSYKYKDDFYIERRTEGYNVVEREDGLINYWSETIESSGKHHISGYGYRGFIGEQTPITLDKLYSRFTKELRMSASYYQPYI